ncbi:hypothetical protein [Paraburkholderia graminis]
MSCATPVLSSGPFGHVPETAGHVAEIAGHDPETAGHLRPKYAAAIILLLSTLKPALPGLLSRLDTLSLGPDWAHVELKFKELTVPSRDQDAPEPLNETELKPLENRSKQVAGKLLGKRILWVDDNFPQANSKEIAALRSLGLAIDTFKSTDDALAVLTRQGYDLVITDMRQASDDFAGKRLLNGMCEANILTPGIIYSYRFDSATGVPRNAAGTSWNRAHLFQLIFDIAELEFPPARCRPNWCTPTSTEPECQRPSPQASGYESLNAPTPPAPISPTSTVGEALPRPSTKPSNLKDK